MYQISYFQWATSEVEKTTMEQTVQTASQFFGLAATSLVWEAA